MNINNTLISEYIETARKHGEGTFSGDSVIANKAYDKLQAILIEIAKSGLDNELFTLYDYGETWIELWSATHTLEIDESKALSKLQIISDAGIPITSMTARYTLKEWNKGSLSFRN